jgi:hypothetical protein
VLEDVDQRIWNLQAETEQLNREILEIEADTQQVRAEFDIREKWNQKIL